MMSPMSSSLRRSSRRPARSAAALTKDPVRPPIAWVWGGIGLALTGLAVGLALVIMGALEGNGPARIQETTFPGTVRFVLTEDIAQVAIYLEFPTLGSAVEAPPHLTPLVLRDNADVVVDASPSIRRVSGVSTELEPIGTFAGAPGHYRVTVDPGGGGGSAKIVVADPARSANGESTIRLGLILGLGIFAVGAVIAIVTGKQRAANRRKLPVLRPPVSPAPAPRVLPK